MARRQRRGRGHRYRRTYHTPLNDVVNVLCKAGVQAVQLDRDPGPEGHVQVGTMHRMKGLEFRCTTVIAVGEHQVPAPSSVTPAEDDELSHRHDLQRERCVLFVACTRAREKLYVSHHGNPSPLLPPSPDRR